MRFTRYGEPSSAEIDSLRIPPFCKCGNPVENYDDLCENCLLSLDQDSKETDLRRRGACTQESRVSSTRPRQ